MVYRGGGPYGQETPFVGNSLQTVLVRKTYVAEGLFIAGTTLTDIKIYQWLVVVHKLT